MQLDILFANKQVELDYDKGKLLNYQTSGSSGFDLRAITVTDSEGLMNHLLDSQFKLRPMQRVLVHTGISVAMQNGFEMQIRSRSGIAWKNGVFVLNSPGTVDSDYRNEIGVILLNTSDDVFIIKRGDRIAQAVIMSIVKVRFVLVKQLNKLDRDGGFGSTGLR